MSINEIDKRWIEGIPHDSRSEEIARAIAEIDRRNSNYFDFRFGGDGDSGEELMYLLDIYFEEKDEN